RFRRHRARGVHGARGRRSGRGLRAGARGVRAYTHRSGRGGAHVRALARARAPRRDRSVFMKYVDEYRDAPSMRELASAIARAATRELTIMEVCGGQTHSLVRHGIDEILPPEVRLVHGPGCPV